MSNWRLNALHNVDDKEEYDRNYKRIFNKEKNMDNLVAQIAIKLRKDENKKVKSVFWNENPGNLSVFNKDGTSYNLPAEGTLDAGLTVDDICELINQDNEKG